MIFGSKQKVPWKKQSKNADNRATKYQIEGASLNLSIQSEEDLNLPENVQEYKAGLDILPALIQDSDDDDDGDSSPMLDDDLPLAKSRPPQEDHTVETSAQTTVPLSQLQQGHRQNYLA